MAIKKKFSSFEDLLSNSEIPVLVDFYATWCGPCQMMSPILEDVAATLKNKLQVIKIDSDKYASLASKYQIHALPTLILFKNGQVVERIEGMRSAENIISLLQKSI